MGDNIQIKLINAQMLEFSEYDLDEMALQVKHRMKADAWGAQSGYDLYCMCKDVFTDYFEIKFNQEATFEVPEKPWGYSVNYITEDSLDANRMALILMQRIEIEIQ